MVLCYILRLYDQVKPKFIVSPSSLLKAQADNSPVIGGDVPLVPFFLAARQRNVTKTYDCRGKRKGVGKGFQGFQG